MEGSPAFFCKGCAKQKKYAIIGKESKLCQYGGFEDKRRKEGRV